MFTGIIEAMGSIAATEDVPGGRRMVVDAPPAVLAGVETGDSIAVDGACLTAVEITDTTFRIDAVLSTLERTVAGTYRPGVRVNLERAMVMGARLDGHMVQGHVDGLGELVALRDEGGTRFLDFRVPRAVWEQTILHGSIALNGISLTVNGLAAPDRLQVAIIPHTWEVTNLADLGVGDRVNVEGDLLGKYVGRLLAARGTAPPGPDVGPGGASDDGPGRPPVPGADPT